MKRYNNIYPKICEKENIRKAILNASKGKKDRRNVRKIIDNIDYYVDEIHKKLITKSYIPSGYKPMIIQDGVRKKKRTIFKPIFYPDQIVHWALMQQIETIIMRGMYDYCCGSVKGRGLKKGVNYLKKILVIDRKNTKYCLKLDITKFYPSINTQILKWKFYKVIKDEETLDLIFKIVDSSESGLPIRKLH